MKKRNLIMAAAVAGFLAGTTQNAFADHHGDKKDHSKSDEAHKCKSKKKEHSCKTKKDKAKKAEKDKDHSCGNGCGN